MHLYDQFIVRVSGDSIEYQAFYARKPRFPFVWVEAKNLVDQKILTEVPSPFHKATEKDGVFTLELFIPWTSLNMNAWTGTKLDIDITISDCDYPGDSFLEKQEQIKELKAISWIGTISLTI